MSALSVKKTTPRRVALMLTAIQTVGQVISVMEVCLYDTAI